MASIITRQGNGRPLSTEQLDANFVNLNNDKVEKNGSTPITGTQKIFELDLTSETPRIQLTSSTATLTIGGTGNTINIPGSLITDFRPSQLLTARAFSIVGSEITAPEIFFNGTGNVELNATIENGAISGSKIATNAVTSIKIAPGAVIESKIATNAVTSIKIAPSAVTTPKIENGAVIESKIATDAVTTPKIQNNAVIESKIATNAVTTPKIQNNAVIESKIATNAVTTPKIENGAVTPTKIATDAVTTPKIQNNAVNADKIATDAVTTPKIENNAITPNKIATTGTFNFPAATINNNPILIGSTVIAEVVIPAGIAKGQCSTINVTVTGAAFNKHVIAQPAVAFTDNVSFTVHVSAANTVKLVVKNDNTANIDTVGQTLDFNFLLIG